MPDIPSSSPTTVPKFTSTLPQGLLDGKTDLEKYLYNSQNEMQQAVAWVATKVAEVQANVAEVHQEARTTNRRLGDIATAAE